MGSVWHAILIARTGDHAAVTRIPSPLLGTCRTTTQKLADAENLNRMPPEKSADIVASGKAPRSSNKRSYRRDSRCTHFQGQSNTSRPVVCCRFFPLPHSLRTTCKRTWCLIFRNQPMPTEPWSLSTHTSKTRGGLPEVPQLLGGPTTPEQARLLCTPAPAAPYRWW